MRSVSGLKWLGFQLAAAGANKSEIARFLGVSRKTVDAWLRPELAKRAKQVQRASHQRHLQERKEKQKQWRNQNKQHLRRKNKKYHEENKNLVKAVSAQWREKNREKLRKNSQKFYSGEKIHSSLSERDCLDIKLQYEAGVRTCDLCVSYGVGPKAIIGAVRHAGGVIRPKTRSLGLADSLSGFLDGLVCRDDKNQAILYFNSTSVEGVYKLGITCESWGARASKNRCNGKIYASLIKTWQLPSRFHGWCIEQCWAALSKPEDLGELAGLNGHTELRAGVESELLELVDSWVASACLPFDSPESRKRAAMLVMATAKPRSAIYRKVKAALSAPDWDQRLLPPEKAKVSVFES